MTSYPEPDCIPATEHKNYPPGPSALEHATPKPAINQLPEVSVDDSGFQLSNAVSTAVTDVHGLVDSKPSEPTTRGVVEGNLLTGSEEEGTTLRMEQEEGIVKTQSVVAHITEQQDAISMGDGGHHNITTRILTPCESPTRQNADDNKLTSEISLNSIAVDAAQLDEAFDAHSGQPTTSEKHIPRSKVGTKENEKQQHDNTDGIKGNDLAEKKEATTDVSEDNEFRDNEDTAAETPRVELTTSVLSRSVPPHMRTTFKAPNFQHLSTKEAKVRCIVIQTQKMLTDSSATGRLLHYVRLALTTRRLDINLRGHR
jgi:hypothetical protein